MIVHFNDITVNSAVIDKIYTIALVYAGIRQYGTFHESKGKLIDSSFYVKYQGREQLPSFDGVTTIEEALEKIQTIDKNARIAYINNQPIEYYNNEKAKTYINASVERMAEYITKECILFFDEVVVPMLKENNWHIGTSMVGFHVPVTKDENGEWDNVKDSEKEFLLDYTCYRFVSRFESHAEAKVQGELAANYSNGFRYLMHNIPTDHLQQSGLLID